MVKLLPCLEELREATLLGSVGVGQCHLPGGGASVLVSHQPSVLRIASEYLATITQGATPRYSLKKVFFTSVVSSEAFRIYASISMYRS